MKKQYPIKFYKKQDGTIYYESAFLNGNAKDMEDAFNQLRKMDLEKDLYLYYDDVIDIQFGQYEDCLPKKYNGMILIGKLNIELELQKDLVIDKEHSVRYLNKHPELLQNQKKFINDLKNAKKVAALKDKFKAGVKKFAGMFEMFYPEKTRDDLICSHCGEIIPRGTYYELYNNGTYHLECIWDKLCREEKHEINYDNSREFFFGLQRYLGHWPNVGLDIQDDYEFDLDLVKHNDRKGNR